MRIYLTISLLFLINYIFPQEQVDVCTGASYVFEVYYNMESGTVQAVDRIEWDIAFSTDSTSSTILANNGKELKVYVYPLGDTSDWLNVNVDSIDNWTPLYNSLDSWEIGAFNRNKTENQEDCGWGTYNQESNSFEGDSIYVLQYYTGEQKKLWIKQKNLTTNQWIIRHANIDGSAEVISTINADLYNSMHLIHYTLLGSTNIAHEPEKNQWDLYFNVFYDYNIPFRLNGVWQNRHIAVQQVNCINQDSCYDYSSSEFSMNPSTIGGDWKYYNWEEVVYELSDSTVFFIRDTTETWGSPIYKIFFTYFGGMTNGMYSFMQEEIIPTGIVPYQSFASTVYPNPATDRISLVTDLRGKGTLKIYDQNGRMVIEKQFNGSGFLNKEILQIDKLHVGIYNIYIESPTGKTQCRFIKD